MSMRLLRLFGGREATAPVARERLQILLAHERGLLGQSDLLVSLREEILAVVSTAGWRRPFSAPAATVRDSTWISDR